MSLKRKQLQFRELKGNIYDASERIRGRNQKLAKWMKPDLPCRSRVTQTLNMIFRKV
jgi:hypothetical protein